MNLAAKVLLAIGLLLTACGGGESDTETGQAAVEVSGVPTGCADIAELQSLSSLIDVPDLTIEDLERLSDGLDRVQDSFDEQPDAVRQYLEQAKEMVDNTVDAASDRDDDPSGEQLALLLGVEMLEREEQVSALSEPAEAWFVEQCGSTIENSVSALDQTDRANERAATSLPASTPVPSPTPTPVPVPVTQVEETSVGANGVWLLMDIEVNHVLRTNMEPAVALGAADVATYEEWVLVGVRISSESTQTTLSADNFAWLDADGDQTLASGLYTPNGEAWSARIGSNESVRGFIAFPGSVGPTDGAKLRIVDGPRVPESIPLAAGAASSPFPIVLASGQKAVAEHTNAGPCDFVLETEIRGAIMELETLSAGDLLHAEGTGRYLTLDVAVTPVSVSRVGCTATNNDMSFRGWPVRLKLSNGDIVSSFLQSGRVAVNVTGRTEITFPIPDANEVPGFSFLDEHGTVLATWEDVVLPDV